MHPRTGPSCRGKYLPRCKYYKFIRISKINNFLYIKPRAASLGVDDGVAVDEARLALEEVGEARVALAQRRVLRRALARLIVHCTKIPDQIIKAEESIYQWKRTLFDRVLQLLLQLFFVGHFLVTQNDD